LTTTLLRLDALRPPSLPSVLCTDRNPPPTELNIRNLRQEGVDPDPPRVRYRAGAMQHLSNVVEVEFSEVRCSNLPRLVAHPGTYRA
jgi:hypothetical protein